MKKKMKFLPVLFILSLVFSAMFSISAFALTDGDWEFQLLDDEVTITGYLGEGGDVVIPEKIFGATVTKVECGRNKGLDNATSITYPGTVKVIEDNFYSYYENTNLTKVIISEGVEEIADSAFSDCVMLKNVKLPTTLKEIGTFAFDGCISITEIEFPIGIEKIGNCSFNGAGLINLDLSKINPEYESGVAGVFSRCKDLTSVKLNKDMTIIPDYMFLECTALKSIDIPNTVTYIGTSAFNDCDSLESVILPVSLKELAGYCFKDCDGLSEIVIPYGTEKIYYYDCFGDCENLKSVYIPDTVTLLYGDILDGSPNAIIYCSADSYAAKFCKEKSISYLTDKSVNSLITVYYNGTRISFHEYDQNPELINDRTLVPLRAIFEAMDADVQWDQATQTVTSTRDGVTIKLTIGANEMYKNGQSIPVDVPAQILNDRTMIPVRVIAEAFGADVEWNGNGRAVLINE